MSIQVRIQVAIQVRIQVAIQVRIQVTPTHHAHLIIFVKPLPYMLVTFVT